MGVRKDREAYNTYMREYHRKNPDKRRHYDLSRKFGISLSEYTHLLESQGGVCAICRQPETTVNCKTKQTQAMAVDHDHLTGEVRGLLCSRCNTAIGLLQDDPDLCLSAFKYLSSGV